MQLATKAITTAIKLATLQQNGRSITRTMCTGRPNIVQREEKAMAKQVISYFRGDNVARRPSEISAYSLLF